VHEVDVRWLRILIPIAVVGLFFSLMVYEDQDRRLGEPFDPFDPKAVQDRLWFGDPLTPAEWVGELNLLAGLGYLAAGLGPRDRTRWSTIVVVFSIAAAAAAAGLAGLSYLVVTDGSSFPLSARGMQAILLGHAVALGALAVAWGRLRRAAVAVSAAEGRPGPERDESVV
jgi:hypothetical protein